MNEIVLLTMTGFGLSALYFLVASGLSLIYGLMGVLNFAHGAVLTFSAFIAFEVGRQIGYDTWGGLMTGLAVGTATGALTAVLIEWIFIRRLYGRHLEQMLVTVGLGLAAVALFEGIWGSDPIQLARPPWLLETTRILGVNIPNDRWLLIGAAVITLLALVLFLKYTEFGLVIRAGVENRTMVTALGIDVRHAFTLVFAIGGAAAGLGGVLASIHLGQVAAHQGTSLMLYAFIVTVIGGLGSLSGAALAAVLVALVQQFANFYAGGTGDIAVVLAMAIVILARPGGLIGKGGS